MIVMMISKHFPSFYLIMSHLWFSLLFLESAIVINHLITLAVMFLYFISYMMEPLRDLPIHLLEVIINLMGFHHHQMQL